MENISANAIITTQEPNQDSALTQWLNITQDKIPEQFESVTTSKFRQMVIALVTGGSPYDVMTDQCPVRLRNTPDGVVASYTATVLVNRSANLEGEYNLVCDGYEVTGPSKGYREKGGELFTDSKEVIELGWLPLPLTFFARQQTGPHLTWEQSNGYFYLSEGKPVLYWVSGTAEVDIWEILVEHQQGQEFPDSTVLAEAYWGENEYTSFEAKIPGCALDAFKKCPGTDNGDFIGFEYATRYIYYDSCRGHLIEIRNREDEE